ncbi:MAG: FeS-binding protein [Desulfosalsimonas sp.]
MKTKAYAITRGRRKIQYVYGLTLFLLALTGFAQMPIFKRYYIADIPGLGWLAEFYTTHFIHYLGAAAILAIGAYFAAEFLLVTRRYRRLSASGSVRAAILCGIMASGILLVIRNSFFVPFSPQFVIVLLLAHLGLTMVFLLFALYCKIAGKPWTAARQKKFDS